MISIEKLIDTEIAKKQEERKSYVRSGKMSPSQFGYCYRKQFWNRKDVESTNPPDARTLRVFKCGNLFEDFVSTYLPKDIDRQVLIETEDIKGYADFVTNDRVIELKSQHSGSFWYLNKANCDITIEKKPNILQVMTYVYYLKKKLGCLIFISKDDLCIKEYEFHIDNWAKEVEEEVAINKRFWAEGKLPPAQPRCYWNKKTNKFKECGWCSYKDKCKGAK